MSLLMEHQQKNKRIRDGAKVMIQFHISYYLITSAGATAIIAAAANLIKRYPSSMSSRRARHPPRRLLSTDQNSLIDDYDGQETFAIQPNSLFDPVLEAPYYPVTESSQTHNQAPPPPYTP